MQDVPTVLTRPDPSVPRRRACHGAVSCAVMVIAWTSVLLPPHRATAQEAATAVRTPQSVARHHTDMGPRAQPHQATSREDAWPRGGRAVQGPEAERQRATRLLGRFGETRAMESRRAPGRRGQVVAAAHHAVAPWGAAHAARGHAKMCAATKRRTAAVAARGALGDNHAMASLRDVWQQAGAWWTAPSESQAFAQDVQEATPTSPPCEAGREAQFTRSLQIIQGHDPSDAVLRSAIRWIGHCGDTRAIPPLLQAWRQRNARQLTDIQRIFKKVSLKEKSEREEAFIAERVIDQILDDINTALEELGIERDRLLHLNRDAVQHGSAKALAILVHYDDKEAIPFLVAFLKKGDNKVTQYHAALEKLGADNEVIFQATLHALAGWNVHATLEIFGQLGDKRAIGPLRHLLAMAEPVHAEAKAVLHQLGASWYDQRSDAERFGLWIGTVVACRMLWRGCRMLWRPRRRPLPPPRGESP